MVVRCSFTFSKNAVMDGIFQRGLVRMGAHSFPAKISETLENFMYTSSGDSKAQPQGNPCVALPLE